MTLILAMLVVFVLLVASEIWWRKKRPHDEFSRKFIHITVGSFVAFWPYFLSWNQIILLSIAFLAVVSVSLRFGIFKAIHAVERPTWGEFCFAAAVGLLALLVHDKLIFTIAILHMSLADGVAAIVGTMLKHNTFYKVLGHRKSVVGSLAFLVISLALLIGYGTVAPHPLNPSVIVLTALIASVLENFAVRGLDNLFVPLFIAAVLSAVG